MDRAARRPGSRICPGDGLSEGIPYLLGHTYRHGDQDFCPLAYTHRHADHPAHGDQYRHAVRADDHADGHDHAHADVNDHTHPPIHTHPAADGGGLG